MWRRFVLFVIVFATIPFVKAETDRKYSDRRLAEATNLIWKALNEIRDSTTNSLQRTEATVSGIVTNVSNIVTTVSDIKAAVSNINTTVATMGESSKSNADLVVQLKENAKDLRDKGDVIGARATLALWIGLTTLLSVGGFLGFVFLPRKVKSTSTNRELSSQRKCPRCGWEHGPGDKVCKNPNCKTQF